MPVPAGRLGWRGQLGLLMPHSDTEPDSEFVALAPERVSMSDSTDLFGA